MNRKSLILVFLSSLLLLKANAFLLPDFTKIGKDPEILSLSPTYLIPGSTVKIIGKNFFESPITANKVYVNNILAKIISTKENELEIRIPRMRNTKNGEIKIFTEYLGYKSKEAIIKNLPITFSPPNISDTNAYLVTPNQKIIVYGDFKNKDALFFKVNNLDLEARILSKNECEIVLPAELQLGPFNIYSFYRKHLNSTQYIDSAPSNEFTLFSDEGSKPLFIRINAEKNIFTSLDDTSSYKVLLFFTSGESCDVTEFSKISISNENIFKIKKSDKLLNPISEGSTSLEADFLWKPTNTNFKYILELSVDLPKTPTFHEVVIDEVFPFASGFIKETDANMDGFPKASEDEFIDFRNLTNKDIDLRNCEVFLNESEKPTYKFSKGSLIKPLSYFTVFSSEENKLNLSNSGSVIEFKCDNKTIDFTSYTGGKNGDPSWQRKEDLSGFIKHPNILFSPGSPPPKITPIPSASPNPISTPIQSPTPTGAPNLSPDSIPTNEITNLSSSVNELNFSDRNPIQIQVFANLSDGSIRDITKEATYKIVGTENVVTIEPDGIIKPIKNGSVTIEVSFEGKLLELIINVNIKSSVKAKQLIINEITAAPTVDTNRDGVFKSDQDEFIEIVNVSGSILDISDLSVADNTRIRHTFPPNTILQNFEPIVIFGGGTLSTFSTTIKSQVADNGTLGLNNLGQEQITITTSDGIIIDQIIFDNANLQGTSLNRIGDLNFTNFIAHDKLLKALGKFSPGTRIDGSLFSSPPQEGHDQIKGSSSSSSGSITSSSSSGLTTSSSSSSSGSQL